MQKNPIWKIITKNIISDLGEQTLGFLRKQLFTKSSKIIQKILQKSKPMVISIANETSQHHEQTNSNCNCRTHEKQKKK